MGILEKNTNKDVLKSEWNGVKRAVIAQIIVAAIYTAVLALFVNNDTLRGLFFLVVLAVGLFIVIFSTSYIVVRTPRVAGGFIVLANAIVLFWLMRLVV